MVGNGILGRDQKRKRTRLPVGQPAAVWCNQLGASQFAFNWNPRVPGHEPTVLSVDGKSWALCYLIMQAAGQDALNAALAIAPDKQITCPSQAPAPD
jgi:hypothetical protein